MVAEQLVGHLNGQCLHDKFQSAYRVGHSTETALLRVLNALLCCADSGNLAVLLMLDLSAAFDTIDHTLLLQRLHGSVGVTGAHLWFSSYLHDRWQYVSVGEASSSTPLHCGVPRGSVLGPILFSLYTTPLGQLIDKHDIPRQQFADDSQLYTCPNKCSFSPVSSAETGALLKRCQGLDAIQQAEAE